MESLAVRREMDAASSTENEPDPTVRENAELSVRAELRPGQSSGAEHQDVN